MSEQLPGPQTSPSHPPETFVQTFVSSGTRLEATLAKATKRASAEMDRPPRPLLPLPGVASEATLACVVVWRATAASGVWKNTRPFETTRLRPLIAGAASEVIGEPSLVSSPPPSRKTRSIISNTVPLRFSS